MIEIGKTYSFQVLNDIPVFKINRGGIGDCIESLHIRIISKRYDFYSVEYRLLGIDNVEIERKRCRIGERDLIRVLMENNVL